MRWAEITGAACRVNTRERLYELHKVTPPQHPIAGFLRSADLKDSDTITDWRYAFSVEALHEANPDRFELKKQVEQRISVGDVFVWDDGRAVSMAVHNRPTPHGCSIGGVYTPPELRGRGYAYACVAALSQHLLDTGKQFCTLFTDLANPTSNAIYQKIGYRPVADFIEYIFEPA
jgi:predicted GNAT family acetyltransferase